LATLYRYIGHVSIDDIAIYIERTKDKGTYSVIVKQNFYYLPSNENTLCT